jgi:hypothetical protein
MTGQASIGGAGGRPSDDLRGGQAWNGGVALGERLSLSGGAARSALSVGSAPRPNSRPWGIDAILARAAGGLSSAIATRTALTGAAGGLRSAGATRTASRAA